MSSLKIKELLLEGKSAAWITLEDGLTRLVELDTQHYRSLAYPRLFKGAKIAPDQRCVYWPGGEFVTAEMVLNATNVTQPLRLLALVPEPRRYRPVLPLLMAAEPPLQVYLDVRPETTICLGLGLKVNEWKTMLRTCSTVPTERVTARLSDLYLLLTGIFPNIMLPSMMRQRWPLGIWRGDSTFTVTLADCLVAGRFELVENPLIRLLLAGQSDLEDVWQMIESGCETPECAETERIDAGRQAGGQRGG